MRRNQSVNEGLVKDPKVSYHSSISNKNPDTVKKLQMPLKDNAQKSIKLEKLIKQQQ